MTKYISVPDANAGNHLRWEATAHSHMEIGPPAPGAADRLASNVRVVTALLEEDRRGKQERERKG